MKDVENDGVCCEDEEECLCPVEGIIDVVSKKWAICIISHLGRDDEGYRFNELQRSLDDISPKSLSDRLKELGEEGLVNRDVEESAPPKVTYTLTSDGEKLHERLEPLVKWVNER
ncbi:MAG: helix-turn-helix domain-containing protein, partial [Candidatus Thermoplasmatota archaeon]